MGSKRIRITPRFHKYNSSLPGALNAQSVRFNQGVMLIFALLVASVGFTCVYCFYRQRFSFWARLNVPFPVPTFPAGNIADVLKASVHFAHALDKLYERLKGSGDYGGLYFFHDPVLFVLTPQFARTVLVKDFNHFVDRGVYSNEKIDPLSGNLFFLEGNRWRKLRFKLAPTFTSGKLKAMFHTIVDVGSRLDRHLAARCARVQRIDVKELLGRFLTDVIGSCAFGIECDSIENPHSQFRLMGRRMIKFPKWKTLKLFVAMMFRKQAQALGVRFTNKDTSDFFLNVVRDTIAYRQRHGVRRDDFMQLLIDMMQGNPSARAGESLTFEEIAAQAFVFFFAGFETSATTLTIALHLLAKHPKIQRKARRSIRSVLAKHDNQLTYDAVMELEYVECIIQETLRLYPPVPTLYRETAQPYQLPNGSILPKGIRVIIPTLSFHHDPTFFPDPCAFKPERFEEKSVWKNNPSYLPFGDGPRMCIGMRFGQLQARLGLAMLLKSYNFTIDELDADRPLPIDPINVLLGPKGSVWLNVERISDANCNT